MQQCTCVDLLFDKINKLELHCKLIKRRKRSAVVCALLPEIDLICPLK
jgi:hypothetical protein